MCQLNNVPITMRHISIAQPIGTLAHWHIGTLTHYLIDTLLYYHSHEEKNIVY